jgi:hypothetical protein
VRHGHEAQPGPRPPRALPLAYVVGAGERGGFGRVGALDAWYGWKDGGMNGTAPIPNVQ